MGSVSRPSSTASQNPWDVEILPDGALLVPERSGRLRIFRNGVAGPPITGLPPIWVRQDGGLMDIALHPDYARTGWLYLAFSETGGTAQGASTTRVIRGKIKDGALIEQQTLFQASQDLYWPDNTHFGARFFWDKDKHLYYSIGDRGHLDTPQDLKSPYGKIHRVNDDGTAPKDNPFVNTPGAVKTIWSLRAPQPAGLRCRPEDGGAVGERARAARRRRAERDREGQELRLAGGHPRDELRRHADDADDGHRGARHGRIPRCSGRRRSRSAASRSIAATSSRSGRATCSRPGWPASSWPDWKWRAAK